MKLGGMESTSASGFNDELTIQISGSRKQIASTVSTAYSAIFDPIRAGSPSAISCRIVPPQAPSSAEHPPILQLPLEEGDTPDHDEQQPSHRACVADLSVLEGVLIEVVNVDGGVVPRPA